MRSYCFANGQAWVLLLLNFHFWKSFEEHNDNEKYSSFSSSSHNTSDLQKPDGRIWEIEGFQTKIANYYHQIMADHSAQAVIISGSLAVAYVMNQVTLLLLFPEIWA